MLWAFSLKKKEENFALPVLHPGVWQEKKIATGLNLASCYGSSAQQYFVLLESSFFLRTEVMSIH